MLSRIKNKINECRRKKDDIESNKQKYKKEKNIIIKKGDIINTIEGSSILDTILKNNDNYVYYNFDADLNMISIADIDREFDREVLTNLLLKSNCNNFFEFKIKLLNDISYSLKDCNIHVKINNVWVNKHDFNNFSEKCVNAFNNLYNKWN